MPRVSINAIQHQKRQKLPRRVVGLRTTSRGTMIMSKPEIGAVSQVGRAVFRGGERKVVNVKIGERVFIYPLLICKSIVKRGNPNIQDLLSTHLHGS